MKRFRSYLAITFYVWALTVLGSPWPAPTQPNEHEISKDIAKPTDPPMLRIPVDLAKRDTTVAPNTCGWVDGDYSSPWLFDGPLTTCFFFSDLHVVNSFTTCFGSVAGQPIPSSCADACKICSGTAPYCGTAIFPSGYTGHGNCQTSPGMVFSVELTYTGQTQVLDFPIYTGNDGLSTGTQDPPSATPVSSGVVATATETNGGSTASSATGKKSTPVGAIVGGTIGGVALIGIVVIIIAILVLLHKRRRPGMNSLPHAPPGPPPVFQQMPPSFQQNLPPVQQNLPPVQQQKFQGHELEQPPAPAELDPLNQMKD